MGREAPKHRYPDTIQTTTLHHILYIKWSVHALIEMIDIRNHSHRQMKSNLIPTSRRCCIMHLSNVLRPVIPFTYSHHGLTVATILYKPSTFTISQVRGVRMSTQLLQGRRHGVLKPSTPHPMVVLQVA